MWFSSGGTKSVVHTDSVENINCVFSGQKKFVLVNPELYGDKVSRARKFKDSNDCYRFVIYLFTIVMLTVCGSI